MSLAALALAAVVAAATPVAQGETPRMTAGFAPGTIPGTVRYQVAVEGVAREDLHGTLGPLHNLVVVAGPFLAQEVAWRDDRTAAITVLTWVLRAPGPGPIGVGETRIGIDGRDVVTREVHGTAFLGGRTSAEPRSPSLRLELSRRRLVVGESLVAEFFLDAAGATTAGAWEVRPSFPSGWSEPLADRTGEAADARPPGRSLGRWLVIPARAGRLEIPAAEASRALTAGADEEPLRPDRALASSPANVEVEALPTPPAGFFGAVGDLTVTRRVTPERLRDGELATLVLEVRGTGNFPLMTAPPFAPPPGLTAFPAEDAHAWEAGRAGLTGHRTWRIPLAAGGAGRVVLPAAELTTFRPGQGWVRHPLGAVELVVAGAAPLARGAGDAARALAGRGFSLAWLLAGVATGAAAAAATVTLRRRRRAARLAGLAAAAPGEELARLRNLLDRASRQRYGSTPFDGEEPLRERGCPPGEAAELVALHAELRRAETAPGLGDREGGTRALAERCRAALARLHAADTLDS